MTDTLVKTTRCSVCTLVVGGTDTEGRCVGCRIKALLTYREQRVLYAIRGLVSGSGLKPTTREVAETVRLPHSTTYTYLKNLRDLGFIDWAEGRTATLRLTRGLG